jgi:hypothetical protein
VREGKPMLPSIQSLLAMTETLATSVCPSPQLPNTECGWIGRTLPMAMLV